MRNQNILRNPGKRLRDVLVLLPLGATLLAGCAESSEDTRTAVTSAATELVPSPATTVPTKEYKAQPGTIANTENAARVPEGTWSYRGPEDTSEDRQKVREQPLAEGSTVQVLCLDKDGRTIDLRQQSPGLGIPDTDDWLQLDTPEGQGPEWVPDVYVDTARPVQEC